MKFKSLALNLNILSEQLKQQDQSCKMSRQTNAADSEYVSNFRSTCYKCNKIRYNMRNCADIDALINQEIVHWDDSDYLTWNKKNTHDISIQFMHDLLWKNDIIKQAKNQETMTAAQANVILIHAADAAIETHETVHSQNIKLCDDDNNSDDTDKKYVDFNSCNSLNVLAALMKTWDKLQSNIKDKNKKVTQE